jgi:flagellar biosynthetic protein FliP
MRAAALRAAAPARIGAGRNTQAPTTPGGQAAEGKPVASGATAPSGAAAADTMVARLAPQLDLRVGGGKGDGLRLSGTVGVVIMMGLLTLLPTLVLMMTGFTRILIVLHFLKQALGTQNAPPNHLVAALALLLTGFVMGPTLQTVNRDAIQPWLSGKMEQTEMMQVGVKPFREFMLRQTRERDIQTFVEMSHPEVAPKTIDDVPLVVVMSAFVTSELRTAFQLGFALFLPFIIIDIVVSSVLMSMGMMMLPPAMIALPCKLLLFVLVDGWTLVIQSLVQSFK